MRAPSIESAVDFVCFVQDKLLFEEDTGCPGALSRLLVGSEARIARGAGVSVICSQGSRLAAALSPQLRAVLRAS